GIATPLQNHYTKIAVRPGSDVAYLYGGNSSVGVFDGGTRQLTTIPLPRTADDLSFAPDGSRAFVITAVNRVSHLSVLDTQTKTVTGDYEIGFINQIAVRPDGRHLDIGHYDARGFTYSITTFDALSGNTTSAPLTDYSFEDTSTYVVSSGFTPDGAR